MKIIILAPLAAATFFPITGASAQNANRTPLQSAVRHMQQARVAQTNTMMDAAGTPQNLQTAPILAGTEWELTDPAYENLPLRPFLKFTDTRLSASVGGNAIGGSYNIDHSKIGFSQLYATKMLAPPPIAAAESEYIKALEGVRELEVSPDGKTLTLRGDTTLTFTATSGMAQQPTPELVPVKTADDLKWTQWQLTKPTYEGLNMRPFLNFTDKGIGAGVGGNSMGGDYSLDKNKITFGQMISTMMMPPPPIAAAENSYKKALEGTHKFSLSKDGMMLTLRGKPNLVYRLVANTPDAFVPESTKIINVAPQLGPQMDGDNASKYLQLEDLSDGVSWGKFTESEIQGFDFVPGNRYQLRVQVERNPRSGEKQLRLLDVVSQKDMSDAQVGENEQIWEVAPTKIDAVGVAPMKVLQVREGNNDAANGETMGAWRAQYAPIEGFDFVEGFKYRILVRSEKVENPPADGSALKYTLVKVLEKNPVTY